jgi:hypothetical protein
VELEDQIVEVHGVTPKRQVVSLITYFDLIMILIITVS